MRKIFLLSLCILLTEFVNAQTNPKRAYIGFTLGPSFPTGDFASTDIRNEGAGFAMTGLHLNLNATYRIGKYLGVAFTYRATSNEVDQAAAEREYTQEFGDLRWVVNSDPWTRHDIFLGGYGSFPLGQSKVELETRCMIAFSIAKSPYMVITAQNASVITEENLAYNESFLVGCGLRIRTSSNVAIHTALDYYPGEIEFQNVISTNYNGETLIQTYKQKFHSWNLGVGVCFLI